MFSGWSRIAIAGKPADLFEPPNPLPFALIYLHSESGETPATNALITDELRSRRLRCIAPLTSRSWWVDRICPEFDLQITAERHVRENVVPWLESTWKCGKRSIGMGGVGMGGQGAIRLGFKYPEQFPIVASVAGALDFHERYGQGTPLDDMYSSREQCRQDTAILHIPPHDWPQLWFACAPSDFWYRGNDRLHEKLIALGVPHTAELDASIKEDRLIPQMLTFIISAIERESRRLT
jgi:enterochelin esterase-like enzyme